jgi:hypothetical protein
MDSANSGNAREQAATRRSSGRLSNRRWIFLLAALALLAFLAMQRSVRRAMKMTVEAAPGAEMLRLKPGDATKVVLELTSVTAGTRAEGRVLERQTETVYRRSANTVRVAFSASTPVVMGKTSDVQPGAVVHVSGTVGEDQTLNATQIVILTGYVQVE